MMNPTDLAIKAMVDHLRTSYQSTFGKLKEEYGEIISWIARMALERIADSDALYHNAEHTMFVTLVGQEIMKGKHIKHGGVTPNEWLHTTIALLCHDIGYVRGVCQGDTREEYVINENGDTVRLPDGASDAALTPYHVDRGKIFVRERFKDHAIINVETVVAALELTRFPVPDDSDHQETSTPAGLVRAADLIGQLSDPGYMRKITGLYAEFKETGTADALNYETAADLARNYPKFYWHAVLPFTRDAINFLNVTQEGKQWVANLYAHVFAIEHDMPHLGPQINAPTDD